MMLRNPLSAAIRRAATRDVEPTRTSALARPDDVTVTPADASAMGGQPTRWPDRHALLTVFVASLVLNLAAAWYLANIPQIGNADGLSRTANAWYTIFSRDPHLSAIGFVWPVLPSLVQIPLLPLVRLLGTPELAGWLMSAVSGGATLAVLAAILGELGVTGWTRLLWLLFVQVHPQFWYLGASGLAEMPALFLLGLAIYGLLRVSRSELALAWIGVALVASFFVRYESLGFMAGFALVLVLMQPWALRRRDPSKGSDTSMEGRLSIERWPGGRLLVQWWPTGTNWRALEGRLLVLLAPSIYGVFFWLLINWMIMGDPIYFQRSEFSLAEAPDVARNLGPSHPLWHAIGSVPATALYATRRLTQIQVSILPLLALALGLAWWLRSRQILGLATLALVAVAFTCAQVFIGTLPPFLRYWSYTTVFAVVLAGACVAGLEQVARHSATALRHGMTALLLTGALLCAAGMRDESASFDERRLGSWFFRDETSEQALKAVDFWWIRAHDSWMLAPILDDVSQHGLTLVDVETAYPSILRAAHPERLVISPDSDFRYMVQYPDVHLRYIAVTDPKFGGKRDLVNTHFPGLYEGEVPWARLVGEVEGTVQPWRIYEVVPDPTTPGRGGERDDIDLRPFKTLSAQTAPTDQPEPADQAAPTAIDPSTNQAAPTDPLAPDPAKATDAPSAVAANDPPTVVAAPAPAAPEAPPATAPPVAQLSHSRTPIFLPLGPAPAPRSEREVVVDSGDSLSAIAEANGTSVDALMQHNGLDDPDLIRPGQVLRIPDPSS
jgi:LysM repeat protein